MTTYCKKCDAPVPAPYAPATPAFQSIDFVTSYLTFYLKGRVDFTVNNLHIKVPNTILGLIPLGSHQRTLDINHISSTASDFHIAFGQFVVGAIIFLLGFGDVFGSRPSFLGVIALLFGLFYALNALQSYVAVTIDSGEVFAIPLVIFEKGKAEVIANNINQMLAARTYDTNVRIHSAASADRIVGAINQR